MTINDSSKNQFSSFSFLFFFFKVKCSKTVLEKAYNKCMFSALVCLLFIPEKADTLECLGRERSSTTNPRVLLPAILNLLPRDKEYRAV